MNKNNQKNEKSKYVLYSIWNNKVIQNIVGEEKYGV